MRAYLKEGAVAAMMKHLLFALLLVTGAGPVHARPPSSDDLTDARIRDLIEQHRPSKGGTVPPDLKYRLGATHVNGQYYLTDEPFIIEGARKIGDLGYGIIKLWFYKADGDAHGYKYHSDWNLSKTMTLKEMAEHEYYQEVFDMPFRVFTLNIRFGYGGDTTKDQTQTLSQVETEFHGLTRYLLETYKDRDVSFILSNWEGDWMLRGGTGKGNQWSKDSIPAHAPICIENMIQWIKARQRGVDRARREAGGSRCKVYNAVEVNKVSMAYGMACLL